MTEYDLTKEQIIKALHVITEAVHANCWNATLSFLEDAKILAQHLQQLQSTGAPSDTQAH